MSKRSARRSGRTIVRTAPVRLLRAITETESVGEKALVQRVGYLLDIVEGIAERTLAEHWNQTDLDAFLDPDQPSFAYKAMAKTFGWPNLKSLGYVPSRVGWMALEAVGRTLRSSGFRRDVITSLIAADEKLLPAKTDAVSLRNLGRRLSKFERDNGRPAASFFELEAGAPKVARQAIFAATDDHICELDESDIRIQLPLVADPQTRKDWVWHAIPYRHPEHLEGSACRPTLRVVGAKLIADMPFERAAAEPVARTDRVLGLDWGVNTPLVGSIVWLADGKPVTDGRPLRFSADGVLTKIHRLADLTEFLSAKIDAQSRVLGIPVETDPADIEIGEDLIHQRAMLWRERSRVSARYSALLDALAHACSRWAIEQAIVNHADTIVLEDLKSLEPKLCAKQNRRVTLGLRGKIADYVIYKAAEVGIKVVTVNPRGTSANCSRCGAKTNHYTAPDSTKAGYRWMRCPSCAVSLDRDHASSERIGGRGLAPQAISVTRALVQATPAPDTQTAPARGSRAKQRRVLYEIRRASSVVTPHQIKTLILAGHRSAGVSAEVGSPIQPHNNFESSSRLPRLLDGMRSALLGQVACSPIRMNYTT